MPHLADRLLLHLAEDRRQPVEPMDIYLVEADQGNTLVRTRHAEPLLDVRQLSYLLPLLEPHGFYQINRSQAVNLRRIREIRRTPDDAWELKLDPPVNVVLPISRRRVADLWTWFGEES